MGVSDEYVYQEPYFNIRHRPEPAVVDAIHARFVARDLFSPYAHQQRALFHLGARSATPTLCRLRRGPAGPGVGVDGRK